MTFLQYYAKSDNSILEWSAQDAYHFRTKMRRGFQPFVDAGECSLHTGGSLSGGQVWALAQLHRDPSEIVKGDEVEVYSYPTVTMAQPVANANHLVV